MVGNNLFFVRGRQGRSEGGELLPQFLVNRARGAAAQVRGDLPQFMLRGDGRELGGVGDAGFL